MFYSILKFFLSPIIRSFWIKEINCLDNVPVTGPVIIAANHASYLDFLSMSVVLRRRIYFLAAEKFYSSAFWRPIMKMTGQIKVERDSKDKSVVLSSAAKILKNEELLGIFPEGTRSRDGKLHKAFLGVAKIAVNNKVNILPLGIKNAFKIYPPQSKFPRLNKDLILNFGEIIDVSKYLDENSSNEEVKRFVDTVLMKKISKLSGLKYDE